MGESQRDVDVSGSRGVTVGDYNTVFQIFAEAGASIGSYIRSAQFQATIEDRTRDFVGREFIFDEIDRLISAPEFTSGYILVRGEPGIGKTSIAASVVLRHGYVHHFNIVHANIRTPRQFLENVCAQLIVRYGLPHTSLPPQAGQDAGFLVQLLTEATEQAGGEPVVVVVDALDEAEPATTSPNRLYLPRSLPRGVFLVVTSRGGPENDLDVDHSQTLWIRDDDPANRRDVSRYIESFVAKHHEAMGERLSQWGLTAEEFADRVVGLSEGNFMYLVYVLPAIADGSLGKDAVGDVNALPRGLTGYYLRHWKSMRQREPESFESRQRPVLCFLAISREPVTVSQLMEWTGLDPGAVTAVLRGWQEFLNEDLQARPPTYRLYHNSFADFLDEQENLRWYHSRLADAALAKIPGF